MNVGELEFATKPKLKEEITLTPKAAEQIAAVRKQNNIPESHGLRVGGKGSGCSGLSYVLGFDAEPKPGDKVFELLGITGFIDPKSLFYLSGSQLDFQDVLTGKRVVFNNRQATR